MAVIGTVVLCWAMAEVVQSFETFVEEFGDGWDNRWVHATNAEYKGKFEVAELEVVNDPALKIPEKARRYGISSVVEPSIDPSNGLILQYEAKWASGHTCSGGYLKVFTHDPTFKPEDLVEKTPYTVMFGPDKCGMTNKVHLILRHQNPNTGEFEEKHLKSPPRVPSDSLSHVYTLVLKKDNTFEVLVDDKKEASGSLFEEFDPPINPPKEIPDPMDKKPDDWVDNAKMADPTATKPEDWVEEEMILDAEATKPEGWLDDEPEMVKDPEAKMPEEWDEEEDGIWEAPTISNPKCAEAPGCGEWKRPMIRNPDYKGEWKPPMIDNPDYKGEWKAQMIPNPDYYVDDEPLKSIGKIGAIGVEVWVMDSDIFFDNILITQSSDLAKGYRAKWKVRNGEESKEKEKWRKANEKKQGAASWLQDLAKNPQLEFMRPVILPLADLAEEHTLLFYIVSFMSAIILLFLLVSCCRRGSKDDAVRASKKEDRTGPDDKPGEDQDKDENEDEDGKIETETEEKDEAEGEDEKAENQTTGPRRRRRAD